MQNTPPRLADEAFLEVLAEAQQRHDHAAKLFMTYAGMHLRSGLAIQERIDAERVLLDRARGSVAHCPASLKKGDCLRSSTPPEERGKPFVSRDDTLFLIKGSRR